MRYIKLFEQNWWENAKEHGGKIPPININGFCVVRTTPNDYFIAEKIVDDEIYLYDNYSDRPNYMLGNTGWSLAEKKDYIKDGSRINVYKLSKNPLTNWRTYSYETLPQEIKDKLK